MKKTVLSIAAIAAATLLSSGCATAFLRSHDELKVVTEPPGVVARAGDASAVTAVGLAVDLSNSKKYSLERDDLVLRLEPARLSEAREGEPR